MFRILMYSRYKINDIHKISLKMNRKDDLFFLCNVFLEFSNSSNKYGALTWFPSIKIKYRDAVAHGP